MHFYRKVHKKVKYKIKKKLKQMRQYKRGETNDMINKEERQMNKKHNISVWKKSSKERKYKK
jgi:hypothetical protein